MSSDRIEQEILLSGPQKKVWRAISDSRELGRWFGAKFERQFARGARVRGMIVPTSVDREIAKSQRPYENTPFEIIVEKMEPERLFSFRWHPFAINPGVDYSAEPMTLVEFTLEPVSNGVLVTVTESGFDRIPAARRERAFAAHQQGWTVQLKLPDEYVSHAPWLAA